MIVSKFCIFLLWKLTEMSRYINYIVLIGCFKKERYIRNSSLLAGGILLPPVLFLLAIQGKETSFGAEND